MLKIRLLQFVILSLLSINVSKAKDAVLLLHGFMGTPKETLSLKNKIHPKNFDIYSPQLPGFGSSIACESQISTIEWRLFIDAKIEKILQTHEKIHLVGFSLGGLLILDYFLRHPEVFEKSVGSISLFAPAIGLKNKNLKWALDTLLSEGVRNIPLHRSPILLKNLVGDLKIPINHPEIYCEKIPLGSARELVSLGNNVSEKLGNKNSSKELWERDLKFNLPVFLSTSESDETIDADLAKKILSLHFKNLTAFTIPKEAGASHQFIIPNESGITNTKFNEMVTDWKKNSIYK